MCISSVIIKYTHFMGLVEWLAAHTYSLSLLLNNRTKKKCSNSPALPHSKELRQATQISFQAKIKLNLQKVRAYLDQKAWITVWLHNLYRTWFLQTFIFFLQSKVFYHWWTFVIDHEIPSTVNSAEEFQRAGPWRLADSIPYSLFFFLIGLLFH